ncbi:WYL domain-containing protein [Moritella viscosa]|uniref:WYL domain-containing protein n=1 Tax=Moritella viscosa TaxID=80854 RepID=UPI0009E5C57E|nr:WYL domain-containing protein [Moritella viscosa]
MKMDTLSLGVKDRLRYIEFLLQFRGWVSRSDLTERFDISAPAATRDFRKYKEIAETNLNFNDSLKRYEIDLKRFKPKFEITIREALGKLRSTTLAKSLGIEGNDRIISPPRLSLPKVDILMSMTRATLNTLPIEVEYFSVKGGLSKRTIVPHSITDSGLRWHVRAYDYKRNKFSDFVLTRIKSCKHLNEVAPSIFAREADHQWNRFIRLELVPHPNTENVAHPKTLEYDYDMIDGVKSIEVRAAIAGYWLRLWNVDCTKEHSLLGKEYQLWLRNTETLYDVESAFMAPQHLPKNPNT